MGKITRSLLSLIPLTPFLLSGSLRAASAIASIGVTILGPADVEVASGAVAVSGLAPLDLTAGKEQTATVRLGGAHAAAFAVTVPEEVTVRGVHGDVTVRPYVPSGERRLSSNGSAELRIGGRIDGDASSASPGLYEGTFPVTIAYN